MSERLKNKVAWISGGCSGMGLGTVEVFVEQGAKVVVADIQADKGAALERRFSGKVRFVECDVTNEEQLVAAVKVAPDTFGGLDIMFNNAGTNGDYQAVEDLTAANWDWLYALLLKSTALACREAVPLMRMRGGGSIINNASGQAVGCFSFGYGAYGAIKAGVLQLSRLFAAELGPERIRVNVIVPGFIRSAILGSMLGESQDIADRMIPYLEDHYKTMQPIPDAGQPRDIGEAVAFLGSDAASWISGVVLPVDGALVVQNQLPPLEDSDPSSFMGALKRARDLAYAELE